MDLDPWSDEQRLVLQGVKFIATAVPLGPVGDQLVIVKSPDLVRRYLQLLEDERPRRIVELGIKAGGSTALIALAADPEIFLAADLEGEIPTLLDELIASHDLGDRLVTEFGLDQGDRAALTRFVDIHLPDAAIDLVIDDASHMLGPTRTSFEVLFPRLRPGGLYVIEDWNTECVAANHLARVLPPDLDFDARLAAVSQVMHILNAPDHDLPPALLASMTASAAANAADPGDGATGDFDSLFHRLVEAAGRSDGAALATLDDIPIGRSRPLSDLAVELMMIRATSPGLIDEVRIDGEWITVRRGAADLPVDGFRLDEAWTDFFGYLR